MDKALYITFYFLEFFRKYIIKNLICDRNHYENYIDNYAFLNEIIYLND